MTANQDATDHLAFDKLRTALERHGDRVSKSGREWVSRCPVHNDGDPSLNFRPTAEGVLVICRSHQCSVDDIMFALGLTKADLFNNPQTKTERSLRVVSRSGEWVKDYPYEAADETALYRVRRGEPKTFTQQMVGPHGTWLSRGPRPDERVLYKLPDVLRAAAAGGEVWVVEGEKDADNLTAAGQLATTAIGGAASAWEPQYTEALRGALVTIVADKDSPGRAKAAKVWTALSAAGITARITEAGAGKDATDHLEAGLGLDAFVAMGDPAGSHPDRDQQTPQTPWDGPAEPPEDPWEGAVEPGSQDEVPIPPDRVPDGYEVGAVHPDGNHVRHIPNMDEDLDRDIPPYIWVIPGAIERGDRMLITAPEGVGKSTFLRQIAIQCVGGVNPFDPTRSMDPVRVLLVDCENSERQFLRETKPLRATLIRECGVDYDPDMFRIERIKGGIDLRDPVRQQWLEDAIIDAGPAILLLGPLYKAIGGNPNDEQDCKPVGLFLEAMCEKYDMALITETHSSKTIINGRRVTDPSGSTFWHKWPEFGYCIEPVDDTTDQDPQNPDLFKWTSWRLDRDSERSWPTLLRRGSDPWPWMPAVMPGGSALTPVTVAETGRVALLVAVSKFVWETPGCIVTQIKKGVKGRGPDVGDAINVLEQGGYIGPSPADKRSRKFICLERYELGMPLRRQGFVPSASPTDE